MKKLLLLFMFPLFVYGQALQFTKWDVQTLQGNVVVLFQNDTLSFLNSNTISFEPIATYEDSSYFFSIVDLPFLNSGCLNVGLYNYQIFNDTLTFNAINDTCGGTGADSRLSFFINSIWTSLNTGVQDEYQPFTLKAFPNPTKEKINISVDNFNGNIQTEVFDLIGNRLKTTSETTISLRGYSKGIYILKVAYGDRVEEFKVIKN